MNGLGMMAATLAGGYNQIGTGAGGYGAARGRDSKTIKAEIDTVLAQLRRANLTENERVALQAQLAILREELSRALEEEKQGRDEESALGEKRREEEKAEAEKRKQEKLAEQEWVRAENIAANKEAQSAVEERRRAAAEELARQKEQAEKKREQDWIDKQRKHQEFLWAEERRKAEDERRKAALQPQQYDDDYDDDALLQQYFQKMPYGAIAGYMADRFRRGGGRW